MIKSLKLFNQIFHLFQSSKCSLFWNTIINLTWELSFMHSSIQLKINLSEVYVKTPKDNEPQIHKNFEKIQHIWQDFYSSTPCPNL